MGAPDLADCSAAIRCLELARTGLEPRWGAYCERDGRTIAATGKSKDEALRALEAKL
jgi:hypothetical protein